MSHTATRWWCLLLLAGGLLSAAQAQTPDSATGRPTPDDQAVAGLVEKLVDSIGQGGIVRFPEMAYPFWLVIGGAEPPIIEIESEDDLGVFGTEGAGLVLGSLETRMVDKVAIVDFTFGPPDDPETRAEGYAILRKVMDFWLVQWVALAPALDPDSEEGKQWAATEPRNRDALTALAAEFGRSITTTGFAPFEGLAAPLAVFDGLRGQFGRFAKAEDFPVPGDPIARSTTRIHAKVMPGLARVSLIAVMDDGILEFQLFCVPTDDGWKIATVVITPPEPVRDTDQPEEEQG